MMFITETEKKTLIPNYTPKKLIDAHSTDRCEQYEETVERIRSFKDPVKC